MAAEQPTTANEYILHHLTFLSNKEPKGIVDFSVIHLDTVFFSAALALLFGGAFYFAARTAKAGVPGKFQNFVELLVETVDAQVKDTFHGTNKLLGPFFSSMPWISCRSTCCPGRLSTWASNI
jgi:F-type H+-transporting ATPase subunit a